MIIGVGTDLVSIDRIAAVLARHGDRFIRRVFAEEEHYSPSPCQGESGVGDIQHAPHPPAHARGPLPLPQGERGAAHYAKRWAAKEAVAKALGVGIDDGVYLRDIVVLRDERGAPRVTLRGGAAAALRARCHPGRSTEGAKTRDLFQAQERMKVPARAPAGLGRDDTVSIHLSLSDDAGFALAFVVVEGA
jgi:holo-[acyl-carrier protein] synthase